jgi:hypothetical protein
VHSAATVRHFPCRGGRIPTNCVPVSSDSAARVRDGGMHDRRATPDGPMQAWEEVVTFSHLSTRHLCWRWAT